MINFVPQLRIFLYVHPVDMRKSYDGLFGMVTQQFQRDVREGGLFLFLNRRRDRVKLFYWDQDGLAIWMKRLEAGRFQLPTVPPEATHLILNVTQLQLLLSGIELQSVKQRRRYVRSTREVA